MEVSLLYKRIMFVLLGLALAQFACNFGAQVPNVNPPQSSSSSQPTQAGSLATGGCANDYLPVKPGAAWTYAGQSATGNFTRVSTITSVETDSFEREIATTLRNGTQRTYTDSWKCTPDGLVLLGGPLATTFQSVYGNATMKTLSTTGVTLPTHINAGDSWTQDAQLAFTSTQVSVNITLTYNFKAIGLESVTVPAGTFNAMKIQIDVTSQATTATRTNNIAVDGFEWFVPGVGTVKSSVGVKVNGTAYPGTEDQMQSYNIP
ncbi:MAG: hypothetical protein WCA79_20805 [Anaerolineales bacterium]